MILLLIDTLTYVGNTLVHNAPALLAGILLAAVIRVYVDPEKFKDALTRRNNVSLLGSVAFGAFTPFCACGTMAVIVAMLTTALPWGPIMAFLTSSPLMSPDMFVMISGILGVKFAVALTLASLIIGLGSGYAATWLEKHTRFLENQGRMQESAMPLATACCGGSRAETAVGQTMTGACCSGNAAPVAEPVACCSGKREAPTVRIANKNDLAGTSFWQRHRLHEVTEVVIDVGVKKVLFNFALFAAVAYFINRFVPADVISGYLGQGNFFAVPLAAIIGLPLYVSGPSSLPIIDTLLQNGASGGAMLAFMITGPGTSAGAVAGIATIMRGRAIAFYVGTLLVSGVVLGYLYDLLLVMGL